MNIQGLMLQQLKGSPQYQQVIRLIGDRNPKDVFYEECKKRNVDPSEILKMFNSKGERK